MKPDEIQQMSDATLYERYQEAKREGPTLLIDDLQNEICERWEEIVERECRVYDPTKED